MKIINESNFNEEIAVGKVLVDFYADWCGPCKMFSEVLENVQDKIEIDIIKVNVDTFPDLASKYNVFSIPTILLLDNLNVLKTHTGYLNPNELIEFINKK